MKGIDISSNQEHINFNAVKAEGIEIVIIKATEGLTYTNPYFQEYYEQARAAGLKIGFYHFLRADDPIAEAKHFIQVMGNYQSDCKYFIDAEEMLDQSVNQLSDNVRKFAEYLKSQNKEPAIYTSDYFYANCLNDAVKDLPLWVAHFEVAKPDAKSYIGFQYSEKGKLPGISTNVDLDDFKNDIFLNNEAIVPHQTIVAKDNKIFNISQIQETLNIRYGLKIATDNIAGSQTEKAIVIGLQSELNKQLNKGLKIDGVPGPKTMAAMITVREGAKGNITWLIQALLICKGCNLNPYGADSDFGKFTYIAVQNFQAKHGLVTDGIVGPKTWVVLIGL